MQKKCPWSLCLLTKSDLLLSNTARLKLSYPATPSSVRSSALTTNNPTQTHTPLLEAFILSLILSLLFTRICSKLSRLRAFYVNLVAHKCEAMVTSQIHILKKRKKTTKKQKKRHFKQICLSIQITKLKGRLYWSDLRKFFSINTEYKTFFSE